MARRAALLCERGGTHEKLMAVQAGSSAAIRAGLIVIRKSPTVVTCAAIGVKGEV